MTESTASELRCANHPDRETMLRCNRCEKPICYQCAILTEVGYRCRECVRGQQAKYYNAQQNDLPLGTGIALVLGIVLGALAYAFLGALGWFGLIGAILAGPAAGGLIAEAVRRTLRRRRARGLKTAAAAATAIGFLLGGALLLAVPVLLAGAPPGYLLGLTPRLFFNLGALLTGFLAASTVYARLL
jgi:hypothetical protein